MASWLQVLGGLGVFLLGMIVMTQGLRELAGEQIRTGLMRFTRSPLSGVVTGASSTAILQSSSATTLATIGFVSAGLMTFPQALGIVLGANIGTTVTGWLVALLGLRLSLGEVVMPFIFVGAILRLFSGGRAASAGFALSGFALLFVGISIMQDGMAQFQGVLTPERFSGDDLAGRLQLVALGLVATIITQSSSAGVAATLSAIDAGVIEVHQAAALVVGMDVGTTVTAVVASLGGSTAARRTALSHVIFNLFAASMAFALMLPYFQLLDALSPTIIGEFPELAVVGFHTSMNLVGVIIVLPLARQFAHLVEALVVERARGYTSRLSSDLLGQPALALHAVHEAVRDEIQALFIQLRTLLSGETAGQRLLLGEMRRALDETQIYIDHIHFEKGSGHEWEQLVSLVHTLDHMRRLQVRCEEEAYRAFVARQAEELADIYRALGDALTVVIESININRWLEAADSAENVSSLIRDQVEPLREQIVDKIAADALDVNEATRRLEALRWMERVSRHVARITHHYKLAAMATAKAEPQSL